MQYEQCDGDSVTRPTIQQAAVQLWQQDVPCVAGPIKLRRQRHLTRSFACLQVCLCEKAKRDQCSAAGVYREIHSFLQAQGNTQEV